MVTASMMVVIMVMMFVHVMVVVLFLYIDHLWLWGCIIDWRRSAIGVLARKRLILIPVLRLIAVHFINYNY